LANVDNGYAVKSVAVQALTTTGINTNNLAAMGKGIDLAAGSIKVPVELNSCFSPDIVKGSDLS
jgi:hypothetical protein